jgi:dihydrodipicolinate synthase/N-acetylneuraminate lyase
VSIKGVCPVLSVPFTSSGEVDYESFRSLVRWIIKIGTKSTLFFGVASENIKLSDPERYQLLEILLTERQGSDLKVITTVADHASELAVKRARDYEAMGVDYINILPPTFFSPSADQINHHLESILSAVKLPVVIQHLPQAGGMADVSGLVELAQRFENLAIVKCEANPPTESIKTVTSLTNGRVRTLIGWGGIFWKDGIEAGTDGLQPGCGVTDLYLWAQESLSAGDQNEFERRINQFIPTIAKWIGNLELLIAAEKDILFQRGIIETNYCRNPTVKIDAQSAEEIKEMLALVNAVASRG